MTSHRFSRLLSLTGWAGMAGGVVVTGLGLSAFAAPDYWFSDNMSFFLRQFLGAGALGLAAALAGLAVSHRWSGGYRTLAVLFAVSYLLLAGLTVGRTLVAAAPGAEADGRSTLRIVSINLEQLYLRDETLTRYLWEIDADILVFQEVGWWWQKKRLAGSDLAEAENRKSPLPDHHYNGELGDIVIFSRYPIRNAKTIVLEGTPVDGEVVSNEILSLDLMVDDTPLKLIAVHPASPRNKPYWEDRQRYLSDLASLTEKAVGGSSGPVVLIGDWNLSPWSAHFVSFLDRFSLGTALDSFIPKTTRFFFDYRLRWLIGAVVDHVAVTADLGISEVKLGPDIGSDHVPLVVDLMMPLSATELNKAQEIPQSID
jgi:endonuclease/exonuclease/phosphatase (EEP) superfamily protein YafD